MISRKRTNHLASRSIAINNRAPIVTIEGIHTNLLPQRIESNSTPGAFSVRKKLVDRVVNAVGNALALEVSECCTKTRLGPASTNVSLTPVTAERGNAACVFTSLQMLVPLA
jgi:hypothetical protein